MATKTPKPDKLRQEKIDAVLESWASTTKYLKELTADEIKAAIAQEKARQHGPRTNILYRLAQRHVTISKARHIEELLR